MDVISPATENSHDKHGALTVQVIASAGEGIFWMKGIKRKITAAPNKPNEKIREYVARD